MVGNYGLKTKKKSDKPKQGQTFLFFIAPLKLNQPTTLPGGVVSIKNKFITIKVWTCLDLL